MPHTRRQRGFSASNVNPKPRAPWASQIMVFADGGNLLQPVNGTAPQPVETVPAGTYDPNGIASYAYAHVKSGNWRADGQKLFLHVETPVYLAGAWRCQVLQRFRADAPPPAAARAWRL